MEKTYIIWDWWKINNCYYAIVEENEILYFSEAEILDNLKGIDDE